jgi:AcrR family transcriptional regulator
MSAKEGEAEGLERRRQPKQSRSVETFNAILEAAARLFETRGYEPTTTHQIAAEAGVSVGALYRYFDDKEAVLKELFVRESSRFRARILEGFSVADLVGQDLKQLARKTMTLVFSIYSERPALRNVLAEQARKVPELEAQRRAQDAEVHQAVHQILSAAPGVQLPDKEIGAYLVSLFMESLIEDYVLYRREHSPFGDDRIIEAASDFILTYILAPRG